MLDYAAFLTPTAPQRSTKQLFEIRPPPPWNPRSPLPTIVDIETFAEVHLRTDDRIKDYLEFRRQNYRQIACRDVISDQLPRAKAHALYANNAYSRIGFAAIALKQIAEHWGLNWGPRCFVTFALAKYAFPVGDSGVPGEQLRSIRRCMGEAANFNIRELQQTARQALPGVPFLGMVEVSLFPHWSARGWAVYDSVSWHCHLLAWGATADELNQLLRPFRRRHTSIKERVAAVHVQQVFDDDILRQFVYALKAPQKAYRTAYLKLQSAELGLSGFGTRAWRLKKDWMRTGDRVRLLDIMADRTLDQLLFGSGEGTELANAIRDEALRPFHTWKNRQPRYRS